MGELPGDREVLDRLKQRNPEFLAGMNVEAEWRRRHRDATGHGDMLDLVESMAENWSQLTDVQILEEAAKIMALPKDGRVSAAARLALLLNATGGTL